MKKAMERTSSLLLALVMALTWLPATALADDSVATVTSAAELAEELGVTPPESGDTVTLSGPLELTKRINVTGSAILDLGGKTLTLAVSGNVALAAKDGGNLTIQNGTVTTAEAFTVLLASKGTLTLGDKLTVVSTAPESAYSLIQANGGGDSGNETVVNIDGADISNEGKLSSLVSATDSGKVKITGGSVTASLAADGHSAVLGQKGGEVEITGGAEITSGDVGNAVSVLSGATVTISNAVIDAGSTGIFVGKGSNPTVDASHATLTVENSEITAEGFGIATNGMDRDYAIIKLSGGSVKSTGTSACGVYLPSGTMDVSGAAEITGAAGIVVRSGTLNVSSGTIRATATVPENERIKVGDVYYDIPAAGIAIDYNEGYGENHVTIGGGTVDGGNVPALSYTARGSSDTDGPQDDEAVFVSGGVFSSPVHKSLLGDGMNYQAENSDGSYSRYSYHKTREEARKAAGGDDGVTWVGEGEDPDPGEPDTPPAEGHAVKLPPDSELGSVTSDKETAAAGETVKLTVTPGKGYQLKSLTVAYTANPDTVVYKYEVEPTESVTEAVTRTFIMPGEGVTVSAVFEPAPLTGAVTIDGEPRSGVTLKVKVTNSNNTGTLSYQWYASETDIVKATGTEYSLTDDDIGKRIICRVTSDVQTGSIRAETAPVVGKDDKLAVYKVTFDMGDHGTAPAEQYVYARGKAEKPADPVEEGYTFDGWYKDAERTTLFNFNSEITADTTIYAKWTKKESPNPPSTTYKITVTSGANGTVTASKTEAAEGETITLTAKPNSGYYLDTVSASTASSPLKLSGSGNTRTFTMPAGDVTVSAAFALISPGETLTGYVIIDGEPWVGEWLEARVRNTNNKGVLRYQWLANGAPLLGETSRYLYLTRYEVGKTISCRVTSSIQTGSIIGRLWTTVDYYDGRYYPPNNSSNNNNNNNSSSGSNSGANQSGSTGNEFTIETPILTTATNTDGTKTTTIVEPDGSSGLVIMTSYGTVASASMTFSSDAFASALRMGGTLTVPAMVQPAHSAGSAAPVRIVLPQASASVKVKIPVSQMTAGTVAVLENYFGPDTVIRSSVSESDGVIFNLTGSAVVKIVDNSKNFQDVSDAAWYANAVRWVSSREVMNGVSAQRFDPEGTVSRAMMAQMLYNFDGANNAGVVSQFSDVSSGDWYAASVSWATKNGIARNYGDRFGAEDVLTREDMAVMLYNYAKAKGYNPYASNSMASYSDNGSISDWAFTAMQWAVGAGLISGTQNGTRAVVLDPQGAVTRAQLATIMQRFSKLY